MNYAPTRNCDMKKFLKPNDLAKASGLSVQSIRNYEQWGFLPTAQRSETGYRRYEQRHLRALHVSRVMIRAYEWERSRNIMTCVHQGNLTSPLATMDAFHAKLHQERQEVERSLEILRTTSEAFDMSMTEGRELTTSHRKHLFRIGEVAQHMGVRVSAVRFWEEQGLLKPIRDRESRFRLYDEEQIRNLHVVVLLRKAGYNFEAIREVLKQLAIGSPEQVLAAAEQRLAELDKRSRLCMEATATLWAYVQELGLV